LGFSLIEVNESRGTFEEIVTGFGSREED